jgi:hypothetical protein
VRRSGRGVYIDVPLLVAISFALAVAIGFVAWLRLGAFYGEYPTESDRTESLTYSAIAAALAIVPPFLAWVYQHRTRWLVVSGIGAFSAVLVIAGIANREVQG